MIAQHGIRHGSFVIFQRIQSGLKKEPLIFVIFQGRGMGGSGPHKYDQKMPQFKVTD